MHDFIAWEYFQQNFNVWARKWIDKSNTRLGYHMICFRNQQIISKYGKLILFKRFSMLITIKRNVHEIIFSNAQWSEIERESFVNLMLHCTWCFIWPIYREFREIGMYQLCSKNHMLWKEKYYTTLKGQSFVHVVQYEKIWNC